MDDFNFDNVILKFKEELNLEITKDDIFSDDLDEVVEKVTKLIKENYTQKYSVAADDQRKEIGRYLYLQILDNAWREHLYSMDTLKTGIGLRGYNQKDPLVEYKKESYNMFMELVASIKYEIIRVLFTVQLRDEEAEKRELEALKAKMEQSNEGITTNLEENTNAVKAGEKKIARNDPCPCGSGKKYKQCCGKSGPKRGVLAK
jgi:preprotein translocase subunit SecA